MKRMPIFLCLIQFVSAKMVTLTNLNPINYISELDSFLFNVSIVGLVSTSWVIVVFMLSRKWAKTPHFYTLGLVISQVIRNSSFSDRLALNKRKCVLKCRISCVL